MGIWQQLFTKAPPPDFRGQGSYATWVEPHLPSPTQEWDRRLRNYAAKCARELGSSRVPTWRSRFPRSGADSYQDAFWVVSVDVDAAERCLVKMNLAPDSGTKAGDFRGSIRGHALVLTPTGGLFNTKVEMWFPPSGDHEEGNLDSLFHNPAIDLLRHSPWAVRNVGRWRKQPDNKVYGATESTMRAEFKSGYPSGAFSGDDPGKGASIALNSFVKGRGRTQWPRYFGDYYG